jgi:hypothetical protein
MTEELRPKRAIRRFDVFAEFNRQKAIKKGMAEDVAAGYGLWLAKLVAARKFGRRGEGGSQKAAGDEGSEEDTLVDGKWRTLEDEAQTDELFREQIIDRMGREFYREVFEPAIAEAMQAGRDYTEIRDEIRAGWKTRAARE